MVKFALPPIEPLPTTVVNVALPTNTVVALANTLAPTETCIVLPVKIPVLNAFGSMLAVEVAFAILMILVLAKTVLLPSAVKNRIDVNCEALSVLPTNTPLLFATTLPMAPVPVI